MAQSLLRTPGFAVFLAGRFLLGLILRSLTLAVGYHVYELTDDPIALGYIGLAMFLPMVCLGLFAGDLADRINRAVVLSVSSLVAAASAIGFLFLAVYDIRALWAFYALTALFGATLAFLRSASPALIPQLVPHAQLANGIAMSSSAGHLATVTGPAAIGLVLILGPAPAYGTVAAISLAMAILWFRLKPYGGHEVAALSKLPLFRRISAGIGFVARKPLILGAMSLDLFAVFLGGVMALLPVYARDILMVGPAGLGLLRSAPAVGSALTALAMSRFSVGRHAGAKMLSGTALFGVALIVFGLSRDLTLSLIALGISGVADTMSNVLRNTVIQLSTPNEMRGRVNAVSQIFVGGSNELGDFRAGVSAGLLGTVPAVVIGGLGTLAVTFLWTFIFPQLRQLDRFTDLTEPGRDALPEKTAGKA